MVDLLREQHQLEPSTMSGAKKESQEAIVFAERHCSLHQVVAIKNRPLAPRKYHGSKVPGFAQRTGMPSTKNSLHKQKKRQGDRAL